jgi:hypothetical protein
MSAGSGSCCEKRAEIDQHDCIGDHDVLKDSGRVGQLQQLLFFSGRSAVWPGDPGFGVI